MATTYPVQHATRAFARTLRGKGPLWLLASAGVGVQLFYFALGPLGRFSSAPLDLRYPVSEEVGFAVGPRAETAVASSFYDQIQVYEEDGRVRGGVRVKLLPDESPLAFDQEGNLYACTREGIEVFDRTLRRTDVFPWDSRNRPGLWKLTAPGKVEFQASGCPTREALRAARGAAPVGAALFLVAEKAGRTTARPVGDPGRCVSQDGSEGSWNPWLARVDFRAQDGTSWSVGTPLALVPFTLVWPGFLWWGVALGVGWVALGRRGRKEDPREARRRQLV